VIVFSPNWLGDAVLALPALGDLRRRYPAARLIVAARDTVASLYGLTPGVDEVVPLEWKGQALAVLSRRHDLSRLRALQADVAILLPNSFSSAWLAARAGVRERWGYAGDFRRSLLSRAVLRPAVRGHQSDYYRHLVRELGVENGPLEPGLDVPEALGESARTLVRSYGWDGSRPLAVLAPGAANGAAKRWPTAHFARLISRLVLEHGAFCALVGGDADRQTTDAVRAQIDSAVRGSVADLAGATTLQVLAGLFHVADVCVSNDSGAMHLAGAVGVPLAALFGPTRERETAPLTRTGGPAEVIINHVWCRPCMLRECPLDHRCMEQLAPDRVVASVVGLMGQRAGAR
jgi:heptosyltransferase-2